MLCSMCSRLNTMPGLLASVQRISVSFGVQGMSSPLSLTVNAFMSISRFAMTRCEDLSSSRISCMRRSTAFTRASTSRGLKGLVI